MSIGRLVLLGAEVAAFAACASRPAANPAASHRVLMEVSSDDPKVWEEMLNNVGNLRNALGPDATDVEGVAHGGGLGKLLRSNEAQPERMDRLAGAVVLTVCENTMRRKKITRADRLPFTTTVDLGVAQLVRKQEQGWSYVKSGF